MPHLLLPTIRKERSYLDEDEQTAALMARALSQQGTPDSSTSQLALLDSCATSQPHGLPQAAALKHSVPDESGSSSTVETGSDPVMKRRSSVPTLQADSEAEEVPSLVRAWSLVKQRGRTMSPQAGRFSTANGALGAGEPVRANTAPLVRPRAGADVDAAPSTPSIRILFARDSISTPGADVPDGRRPVTQGRSVSPLRKVASKNSNEDDESSSPNGSRVTSPLKKVSSGEEGPITYVVPAVARMRLEAKTAGSGRSSNSSVMSDAAQLFSGSERLAVRMPTPANSTRPSSYSSEMSEDVTGLMRRVRDSRDLIVDVADDASTSQGSDAPDVRPSIIPTRDNSMLSESLESNASFSLADHFPAHRRGNISIAQEDLVPSLADIPEESSSFTLNLTLEKVSEVVAAEIRKDPVTGRPRTGTGSILRKPDGVKKLRPTSVRFKSARHEDQPVSDNPDMPKWFWQFEGQGAQLFFMPYSPEYSSLIEQRYQQYLVRRMALRFHV